MREESGLNIEVTFNKENNTVQYHKSAWLNPTDCSYNIGKLLWKHWLEVQNSDDETELLEAELDMLEWIVNHPQKVRSIADYVKARREELIEKLDMI